MIGAAIVAAFQPSEAMRRLTASSRAARVNEPSLFLDKFSRRGRFTPAYTRATASAAGRSSK